MLLSEILEEMDRERRKTKWINGAWPGMVLSQAPSGKFTAGFDLSPGDEERLTKMLGKVRAMRRKK